MNKFSTILLAATALSLGSCSLDQAPFSEVASDDYVKDAASVNNLVIGTYNALHDAMYYEWAVTELRSDNARQYSNTSTSNNTKLTEQLDQGAIGAEHQWVSSYWDGCYATIARANNVLSYIDVVEDPSLRAQYEGEARFLRALEYFNLVRLWGPVFIVTSKTPSDVARNMQRSPVEDVYALIEEDLEAVVNGQLLPSSQPDSELGRADLTAAKALLAKVYATHYQAGDNKYARAAELCLEVLQSPRVGNPQSGADLVPYDLIFAIDNEMNREIIFAVRYLSGNKGLGSPFGNLFAPLNNGANVIVGTANSFNTPSDDIINAYNNRGADKRLDVNIAQRYYNFTTQTWVETGNCRYCRKYTNEVTRQYDGESDWPVIRVADIALLYAEISNEISGPTPQALTYLNMICDRAGVPGYEMADVANRYDFRQAIHNERRLELAFENQRWFDLLRWGEAATTVNNFFKTETFYAGYSYTVNPIADWQTILPVPISVLNINPDVAQNPGY